jgi:hypothetical protein
MSYPVMLGAVVIDTGNQAIIIREGGAEITATVAAGTYYLRGDGASGDLCLAIKTALDASTGALTYSCSVSMSTDGSGVSSTVSIGGGGGTFSLEWASSNCTFDERLLGFASANTASNTSTKSGTLSPSCLWVSSEVYSSLDAESEFIAHTARSRSGRVWGALRGGAYDVRSLSMLFLHANRAHSSNNSTDTASGLDQFIERQLAGLPMELHLGTISSGTTLAALSSSTEHGDRWMLDAESTQSYMPQRLSPGVPLYSAQLRLLGYVA